MIEATQRDIDAAADFLEAWEPGPEMTVVKLARAFARHRSDDAARIAALEDALRRIAEDDIPRPVAYPYWQQGPSKLDRCAHDRTMREDCGECISDFATTALEQKP